MLCCHQLLVNFSLLTIGDCPDKTAHCYIRIRTRHLNNSEDQPNGIAFRNCALVMAPRFGNDYVRTNMNILYGVSIQPNCNNEVDFTYSASVFPTPPPIPRESVNLWFSYRYVAKSNTPRKNLHLYFILSQFYGKSIPLSRTRNPVLLLSS